MNKAGLYRTIIILVEVTLIMALMINVASAADTGTSVNHLSGNLLQMLVDLAVVIALIMLSALKGLMELVKTLFKFFVIGTVAVTLTWGLLDNLLHLLSETAEQGMLDAVEMILWSFLLTASSMLIIATMDVPYQIWDHAQKLKMSFQDIKEEMKNTEGKPEVKSKIRNTQTELVPSLLLSTAAAFMVTRVSSSHDIGGQVLSQIFNNTKVMIITGSVMTILGLIPGMPHIAFLSIAAVAFAGAYYINLRNQQTEKQELQLAEQQQETPDVQEEKKLSWDDVAAVDMIGLEIGYRLIPLVDEAQNGQLMTRVKGVRKKISQDLGFLVPIVHIRDNLDLAPNAFRITLKGVVMSESEIHVDRLMAINPGQIFGDLEGIKTKDPSFGLDAIWIDESKRDHAQTLGYTVVDVSTVIATNLSQVIQDNAVRLLGHEEVQQLLEKIAAKNPKLVEELVPGKLSMSTIVTVLQQLLDEHVPITDFRTITEILAETANKSQEPDILVAAVRIGLADLIIQKINNNQSDLSVITLDPELEQILLQSLQRDGQTSGVFEPGLAERIQVSLKQTVQKMEVAGQAAVLLVPGQIRRILARFCHSSTPELSVLSYQEIPDRQQVKVVSVIGK